jgi:hypothetical protein
MNDSRIILVTGVIPTGKLIGYLSVRQVAWNIPITFYYNVNRSQPWDRTYLKDYEALPRKELLLWVHWPYKAPVFDRIICGTYTRGL